jgi:hypothetical protein
LRKDAHIDNLAACITFKLVLFWYHTFTVP